VSSAVRGAELGFATTGPREAGPGQELSHFLKIETIQGDSVGQDFLKFFDVDGYRCDVAHEVPLDFWEAAIDSIESVKPVLMLAEAELGLGNPDVAAQWVNEVRNMPLQQAGLPDMTTATLQDIRNERKVALFGRALAFYDARRLGEIDARSEGGGIQDVWVYHIDGNGDLVLDTDADIYFDFLDYYAIPDAESDFNPSADVGPEM